jgi:hypothetical protein
MSPLLAAPSACGRGISRHQPSHPKLTHLLDQSTRLTLIVGGFRTPARLARAPRSLSRRASSASRQSRRATHGVPDPRQQAPLAPVEPPARLVSPSTTPDAGGGGAGASASSRYAPSAIGLRAMLRGPSMSAGPGWRFARESQSHSAAPQPSECARRATESWPPLAVRRGAWGAGGWGGGGGWRVHRRDVDTRAVHVSRRYGIPRHGHRTGSAVVSGLWDAPSLRRHSRREGLGPAGGGAGGGGRCLLVVHSSRRTNRRSASRIQLRAYDAAASACAKAWPPPPSDIGRAAGLASRRRRDPRAIESAGGAGVVRRGRLGAAIALVLLTSDWIDAGGAPGWIDAASAGRDDHQQLAVYARGVTRNERPPRSEAAGVDIRTSRAMQPAPAAEDPAPTGVMTAGGRPRHVSCRRAQRHALPIPWALRDEFRQHAEETR